MMLETLNYMVAGLLILLGILAYILDSNFARITRELQKDSEKQYKGGDLGWFALALALFLALLLSYSTYKTARKLERTTENIQRIWNF